MNRKNKDLRVVRDSEDVDKLVRRIMDNTEDEETQMARTGGTGERRIKRRSE